MATWTVSTYYKKSVQEVEHWVRQEGKGKITTINGFRYGEWTVETSDDNPPEFEFAQVPGGNDAVDSIDMNSCYTNNIEEVEMNETWDGCWDDIEWPEDLDDDERSELEAAIDEDGYYSALEDNDWWHDDTEMWIWGPIEIKNEAGDTVRIICADDEGNVIDFKED